MTIPDWSILTDTWVKGCSFTSAMSSLWSRWLATRTLTVILCCLSSQTGCCFPVILFLKAGCRSNTRHWVQILQRMEKEQLVALVPGHGGVAEKPNEAISLTRRYLVYLREKMGQAVDEFVPFSEVYDETDWTGFDHLPAFEETNRRNAYQVYLSMEAEMLGAQ